VDRLVAALEQGMADEALERLDPPRQRRRRQRQRLGGGLDRAQPGDLDERLDRRERRQSAHRKASPLVRCT
jgi:hypothetical protein